MELLWKLFALHEGFDYYLKRGRQPAVVSVLFLEHMNLESLASDCVESCFIHDLEPLFRAAQKFPESLDQTKPIVLLVDVRVLLCHRCNDFRPLCFGPFRAPMALVPSPP